mgnify:CR=1 FL=1
MFCALVYLVFSRSLGDYLTRTTSKCKNMIDNNGCAEENTSNMDTPR